MGADEEEEREDQQKEQGVVVERQTDADHKPHSGLRITVLILNSFLNRLI